MSFKNPICTYSALHFIYSEGHTEWNSWKKLFPSPLRAAGGSQCQIPTEVICWFIVIYSLQFRGLFYHFKPQERNRGSSSWDRKFPHSLLLPSAFSCVYQDNFARWDHSQTSKQTLEAAEAGDQVEEKIFFFWSTRCWIPAFKLLGFSFWKKGMHFWVSVCTHFSRWMSIAVGGHVITYGPRVYYSEGSIQWILI